jgi:hypothetical protein
VESTLWTQRAADHKEGRVEDEAEAGDEHGGGAGPQGHTGQAHPGHRSLGRQTMTDPSRPLVGCYADYSVVTTPDPSLPPVGC